MGWARWHCWARMSARACCGCETLPLSVLLVIPAMAGLLLGFKIHDRIDQVTFRRATLLVLLIAGLNLIRRGF